MHDISFVTCMCEMSILPSTIWALFTSPNSAKLHILKHAAGITPKHVEAFTTT